MRTLNNFKEKIWQKFSIIFLDIGPEKNVDLDQFLALLYDVPNNN